MEAIEVRWEGEGEERRRRRRRRRRRDIEECPNLERSGIKPLTSCHKSHPSGSGSPSFLFSGLLPTHPSKEISKKCSNICSSSSSPFFYTFPFPSSPGHLNRTFDDLKLVLISSNLPRILPPPRVDTPPSFFPHFVSLVIISSFF
ncbi:hypothetical protein IE53DRAFT_77590 [Violaceomyces palustris]|uniref:Uncharacterized protein n=1 Tax=Violaceomyces palustris TaxID=1673888 RepID=A0ACD0NYG3_9BASI|nr:hypothetical protein IE53DRAFT_77590 [Violaceomyces palustris]